MPVLYLSGTGVTLIALLLDRMMVMLQAMRLGRMIHSTMILGETPTLSLTIHITAKMKFTS
jgi:hypothetical protein